MPSLNGFGPRGLARFFWGGVVLTTIATCLAIAHVESVYLPIVLGISTVGTYVQLHLARRDERAARDENASDAKGDEGSPNA